MKDCHHKFNDRHLENSTEDKECENIKFENKEDQTSTKKDTESVSVEQCDKTIIECSELNTDYVANTTTMTTDNNCSDVAKNIFETPSSDPIKECGQTKPENSGIKTVDVSSDNDVLINSNINQHRVVDSCNDVLQEKLFESKKESFNSIKEEFCNSEKSLQLSDKELSQKPKEQPCNDNALTAVKQSQNAPTNHDKVNASTDTKESQNVPSNYDKINELTDTKQIQIVPNNNDQINSIQTETKQLKDPVLSNKLRTDLVETVKSFNNSTVCNDFSKSDTSIHPLVVPSLNEKQFDNSLVSSNYCKPLTDSALPSSNIKPYSNDSLSTEYCKTTDTVLPQNAKQYSDVLLNEYQKLDVLQQPDLNKSMLFSKDKSVEFNKNLLTLPVPTNSSQEIFKVAEQSKTKASEKNYCRSVLTDNTITVPKYDTSKHEKQSKRTTPSPKTVPYRIPPEVVPAIEKSRLHDYLTPMGFVNYQKMNNPVAVGFSDVSKSTKDMYSDKKSDSLNMNLPKDKDAMNLPKSIDNSLLYSSVMQQSPYTDQSMMHLTLQHHLAHSSQYHHSAPSVPAQVPPPPHQTKSRSKKSEQRRLAQQNQTPVALASSQQSTQSSSLPSHTQSYHHHHQTSTYMMPQPSPSSPYHHSVIQHRMGQQGGSCSSADFYLSHSNQHAAAAAAQIASCNLSKLQQMTNGLDHQRRHISSPSSSPALSPANMTPPPPVVSAAAAHLLQQTYHKLYQQAGQTNQSRQYGHQSRNSPSTSNVGLMSMQYGAHPPFNGYRVTPQSTPPPSAAGYINQTSGQLQYATHSQDPHHQNGVYPASAYNGSYLQPLNGSMHR